MTRQRKLALVALGVLLFLVLSALLARVLSVDGAERSAITGLIEAEARGDRPAMLARMSDCRAPACVSRISADAAALRRAGQVSILQLQTSAGFSLGSTLGVARVAWKTPASLPIVQCVRVRRAGNVLSGLQVNLLAITPRIRSDADCPARF